MLAKRFLARVPRVKTSSAAFAQLRAFSTSTGGDSAQEESVRTHTLASVNYPAFWTAPTKPCPSQDPFAAPHYREYNFVTYPVLAEPHEWSLPIRHKLSCEETYDVPMIEGAHQMVNKRQHIKARIDINTADLDPVFTPYQKEIFIKLAGRRYHAPSSKIVIASREMPGLIANENRVYQYLEQMVQRTIALDAQFTAEYTAMMGERKEYDDAIAQARAQVEESKAAAAAGTAGNE